MSATEKSQIDDRLAEERSALVGKIAAGLAHDLNGPIGIVLGFNDLSREIIAAGGGDGRLSTDQVSKISEYLSLVDGAAKRARTLTQEIWEFAKSEPGTTTEFAVEDQLSLAARLAAPALRSFGIETPEQPPEQSSDGEDNESGPAATVRYVDPVAPVRAVLGEPAGDEEGVGPGNQGRLVAGQGGATIDEPLIANVYEIVGETIAAGLDVFRAVAKTLRHPDFECISV